MKLIYANVAKTTLAGPINGTTTTIVVQAGSGALFPNPTQNQYFTITMIPASTGIPGEIMWCTSRSGDTLTVIRGQEGTTGTAYLAGDTVSNRVTASGLLAMGQFPTYAGDPNTFLAGQAGTAEISPDMVWDTTNQIYWVCTIPSTNPATAVWTPVGNFKTLFANRNYYVNASTGNDSNDGLTSGTPWLTLQHAWNYIQSTLNLNGFQITVNCTGAFTAGIQGQGGLVGATLGSVALVWQFTGASSVAATNSSCFQAGLGAAFAVSTSGGGTLTLTATGSGPNQGCAMLASSGGIISLISGGVTIGSCANAQMRAQGSGSQVGYSANFTVTGTSQNLMLATQAGLVGGASAGLTITASGTPSYSSSTAGVTTCGIIEVGGTTFSGAATGVRYNAASNGVIDTAGGGATAIFGNSAGTVNLVGGVYGNGSGQYL